MKIHIRPLQPSIIEHVALIVLTVGIVLLANSKQLLGYYGLQTSDQLLKTNVGDTVQTALRSVDSLSATSGVVTFMIWAVVGVVCFGIVEGLASAAREVRLESRLSSGRYIHPATFTKQSYWRGIVLNSVTLVFGLLLLAIITLGLMLLVVPIGLTYTRPFLFGYSMSSVLYLLLGLAVIYVGLIILNVCIRLLLHRRAVFSL